MNGHLDLRVLLAGCSEALRLEGRRAYADPDSHIAFARSQRTGATARPSQQWPRIVRDATRASTQVGRLRLVTDPLTAYERWELGVYASGWARGEDVRVLPRFRRPYRCDVWIIDRARAVWLLYDPAGHLERVEERPADAECQFWARRWDEATVTPAAYLAWSPAIAQSSPGPDSTRAGGGAATRRSRRLPVQRPAIGDVVRPASRTG